MFDKITIIGCGLIGSSLLRVIDKKKLSKQINVFDKSKDNSEFIKNNFTAKVFKDEIFVKLPSSKIVKLEIIDVKDVPVEDQEDISKKAQALSSLFSIKTPKVALPLTIGSKVKKTQNAALDSLIRDLEKT